MRTYRGMEMRGKEWKWKNKKENKVKKHSQPVKLVSSSSHFFVYLAASTASSYFTSMSCCRCFLLFILIWIPFSFSSSCDVCLQNSLSWFFFMLLYFKNKIKMKCFFHFFAAFFIHSFSLHFFREETFHPNIITRAIKKRYSPKHYLFYYFYAHSLLRAHNFFACYALSSFNSFTSFNYVIYFYGYKAKMER